MNEVNVLHRIVCNGVLSEIKILEALTIDEYASTLNAWKYELHLKNDKLPKGD
jgi:hypothetical protein